MKVRPLIALSVLCLSPVAAEELSLSEGRIEAVYNARVTHESVSSVILRSSSAE